MVATRDEGEARIHAVLVGATRLGPGRRAVVWFQGCPFRCRGCITPDALSFDGGTVMDVEEVVRGINTRGGIDGVTCSGGEPFAQPEALAAILHGTRRLRLGSIVFSGYELDCLRRLGSRRPAVADALALVDVLIDGVYIEAANVSKTGLRGSDNQRIHFLTDRGRSELDYFSTYDRGAFEILPTTAGEAMLVGVPNRRAGSVWQILGTAGRAGGNDE